MIDVLTQQQKEARKGRITSSIVAAVVGMDPYSSPYDAQMKIRGQDAFAGNAATERGNVLEDVVLSYGAKGLEHLELVAPPRFVDDVSPWSGDSADGLLCDASGRAQYVLEAKTVSSAGGYAWGEDGTDEVPERVLAQCHWHLIHHPSAQECLVPVLFGGDGFVFRCYRLPRDAEFEAFLWREAETWHRRHIAGDEAVPLSHSDADRRHLLAAAPRDWDETWIPPSAEDLELVQRRMKAAEEVKAAEKELALCNNLLRDRIGEAAGLDTAEHGFSVTYRKNRDGAQTDWQAVARSLGAKEKLIYEHTRVVPGDRVLRVAKRRAPAVK